MNLLFVYGTLKQGQPNHYVFENLDDKCRFIGKVDTVEKYPLVIATKFNLPFLLYVPGRGSNISGELYELNDEALVWMDDFEDCPSVYMRVQIAVKLHQNIESNFQSKVLNAWTYTRNSFPSFFLDLQYYQNYDSFGSHGRIYLRGVDEISPENVDQVFEEERVLEHKIINTSVQ